MPSISDFLFGTKSKFQQQPTQSPQQQNYIMQLLQGLQGGQSNIPGLNYLQSLFSNEPEAYQDYEAPALRQFNEQIIPGIAERFTGLGAGSRNSSAFQQQIAGAGSRLSENLAGQRAGLRSGAANQLMGYGQMGMNPQFENIYMRGQPGLFGGLSSGVGSALGMGAGLGMGGGIYNLFNGGGNSGFGGNQNNQNPYMNPYGGMGAMGGQGRGYYGAGY